MKPPLRLWLRQTARTALTLIACLAVYAVAEIINTHGIPL